MRRFSPSLASAALLSLGALVASPVAAQTTIVVESPPPPPIIVVVEPPPPAQVVVVEPPPPAQVVVVEQAPPPEPAPPPTPGVAPRFLLDLRGELLAGGNGPELGAGLMGGVLFGSGISLHLAASYATSMGWGPNVASLGVEIERDFSPSDPVGFLVVGRIGSAFVLDGPDPLDSGIRLSGQVGIGGRFDITSDVALTTDLRGALRFRPDDPLGPSGNDLDFALLLTMGVRIRM